MTNDTNTLNGALTELGEVMAENLTGKGVPSDASEGLTTLAKKIKDITFDLTASITLTASATEVLLNQQVDFSASLINVNNDPIVNAVIYFKTSNGDVIGSAVTDENGVAIYTHIMDTFGSVDVHAEFAGLLTCTSQSVTVDCNYDLDLTADKSILSLEDNESCTITGVLTDAAGSFVENESINYEMVHDGNVLTSGSLVTDENGEISIDYDSVGVGDVDVIFSLRSILQKTYIIEDVYSYDDTTTDKTSDYDFSRVVYDSRNNGSQSISFKNDEYTVSVGYGGSYYFIPLTTKSEVELSYISKSAHTTDNSDCGFGLIDINEKKGNAVYTRVTGAKPLRRFTKISSETSWEHIYNQNSSSLVDIEIKHILTVNGLSFTYKAIRTDTGTVIWEYSNTFDDDLAGSELGIITGWGSCSHSIKQIKIKAL